MSSQFSRIKVLIFFLLHIMDCKRVSSVEVVSVNPLFGPKSGGTNVSLIGKNFKEVFNQTVFLNGRECKIYRIDDSEILCISSPYLEGNQVELKQLLNNTDQNQIAEYILETTNSDQNKSSGDIILTFYERGIPNGEVSSLHVEHSFHYVDDPSVESISTHASIFSGGINVTVTGKHLDSVRDPVMIVTFNDVFSVDVLEKACIHGEPKDKQLICTTPAIDPMLGGPVRVCVSFRMDGVLFEECSENLRMTYYPDPDFHSNLKNQAFVSNDDMQIKIQDPYIYGMYPAFEPKSGGTNITFIGKNLNSGYNRTVNLSGEECKIYKVEETIIMCFISQFLHKNSTDKNPESGYVVLSVYRNENDSSPLSTEFPLKNLIFHYQENPIVDSISRRSSIFSGGISITVTGRRFISINQPSIVVSYNDVFHMDTSEKACLHGSPMDEQLLCETPPIEPMLGGPIRVCVSPRKDGVPSKDCPENLVVTYYPDPEFIESFVFVSKDTVHIKLKSKEPLLGFEVTDVSVLVNGSQKCVVAQVTGNTLFCSLQHVKALLDDVKNGTPLSLTVYIGGSKIVLEDIIWVNGSHSNSTEFELLLEKSHEDSGVKKISSYAGSIMNSLFKGKNSNLKMNHAEHDESRSMTSSGNQSIVTGRADWTIVVSCIWIIAALSIDHYKLFLNRIRKGKENKGTETGVTKFPENSKVSGKSLDSLVVAREHGIVSSLSDLHV